MHYLLKVSFPVAAGNAALADPQFGEKMQRLLAEIKAEATYFTSINGQRGAYIVVNMEDASEIPGIAEPFFLWLKADLEFIPVMLPAELAKAAPAIAAACSNWG